MKLLLVTLYFPPAGGGGVQRPLKFASHLPALGIETHVLAPDDPKWVHEDADLPLPTQAWIHRARYLGPRSRRLADELHGRSGVDLALRQASSVGRRADAIVAASEAIAEETRAIAPRGRVVTIENGSDFDDFAGLGYSRGDRFRLTHAGSFFGKRDPKPFLRALVESGLEDVTVRFVGDFRPGDREFLATLGLGDRVELIEYVPRRESLRLQRDSDALLLLIPDAGGRGRGVLSGKVFEYLAAERPVLAVVPTDGAAAELVRETGAGLVAGPDDVPAIRDALVALHAQWRDGTLAAAPLSPKWRDRLSRASRVEELAELLESVVWLR